MLVEIKPPGWYPFHQDKDETLRFRLRSVAVWVIFDNVYFLAVQQADKPGNPWGIPGGRVDRRDHNYKAVAVRELKEETGIVLDENEINYLGFIFKRQKPDNGHLLYLANVKIDRIPSKDFIKDEDGTLRFNPPEEVNTTEICQLALIPLDNAFRNNLLNGNPYHPEYTYHGYTYLRSYGLIRGSFPFENDPGL